jgi:hypothetical protein
MVPVLLVPMSALLSLESGVGVYLLAAQLIHVACLVTPV